MYRYTKVTWEKPIQRAKKDKEHRCMDITAANFVNSHETNEAINLFSFILQVTFREFVVSGVP